MSKLNKNPDHKNLKTRYLIWLYKNAKEELDRIDRKFTQLEIDNFLFKRLSDSLKNQPVNQKKSYQKQLKAFLAYISDKENAAQQAKFNQKGFPRVEYQFLRVKLSAIEETIKKLLGESWLNKVRLLYHQEMIRRILQERQHK